MDCPLVRKGIKMITQKILKELFEYKDGHLFWKKSRIASKSGLPAGCEKSYRWIKINRKLYPEHRLVWMYHYGIFPEKQLDHINRVKTDNHIENLREVTASQNCLNKASNKNTSSKKKNITFHKKTNKWQVNIWLNKKLKHLGLYRHIDIAETIAKLARHKYHGEFACHE
jgi:hypothetical protein